MKCPCCGAEAEIDFAVSLETNTAIRRGEVAHLSPGEAELLEALRRRFPGSVTIPFLVDMLYGKFSTQPDRMKALEISLRVRVSKLRQKVAPLGLVIEAVRGVGWRLVQR